MLESFLTTITDDDRYEKAYNKLVKGRKDGKEKEEITMDKFVDQFIAEGFENGKNTLKTLHSKMKADGRMDDYEKAMLSENDNLLNELFNEYGLNKQ